MNLKQKFNTFAVGVLLALENERKGVLNDWFTNSTTGVRSYFGLGAGPAGQTTVGDLVTNVLQILLLVAGSVAVVFLVLGGFRYITSRGNEEATESAKKTMTAAIVGLVVIIMAFAAVYIVSQLLITGNTGIGP